MDHYAKCGSGWVKDLPAQGRNVGRTSQGVPGKDPPKK
jgi:hypothetical protein